MARNKKKARVEVISGGYSAIPWAVLDSESFKGASDKARSLLFALMRQHNGQNNGRLHLASGWLLEHGWRSKSNNVIARDELIERGLIIQTRVGGLNMGAAWFALTWYDISNYIGLDIEAKNYQRGKYTLCNLPPAKRRKPPIKKIMRPDYRASADPCIGLVSKTTDPTIGAKKRIIYRLTDPTIGDNVITPLPLLIFAKRNINCYGKASDRSVIK